MELCSGRQVDADCSFVVYILTNLLVCSLACPRLCLMAFALSPHPAGLSRVLCLPKGEDVHETAICKSYRVAQVSPSLFNSMWREGKSW